MKRIAQLVTRPRGYVLGTSSALALAFAGSVSALTSCSDPTVSGDFATPVTASGDGGSNSSLGAVCPGGATATQGPLGPDASYCNSPAGYLEAYNEDCMPGADWIPGPGLPPVPVRMFTPPPHPDTECPFYRGAYQNFMIAMNPLGANAGAGQSPSDPVLVNYPTIDDAFTSTIPHLTRNTGTSYATGVAAHAALVAAGTKTGRAWLGAVRQAGLRNVLIDQDDHTLYYGLHMNQAFYDFIQANHLNTVNGILNVDPGLSFPPGLVEFKTAWKDIDPQDFPGGVVPPPPEGDFAIGSNSQYLIPSGQAVLTATSGTAPTWDANYITTMAWLPYLTQDPTTGRMNEDADHPVLRKVALVAIHSVYTLPGHPEFVWGSIQHVNLNAYDPAPIAFAGVFTQGAPDSQPNTTGPDGKPALPSLNDPDNLMVSQPPSMNNYLLYHGGTPENKANQPLSAGNTSAGPTQVLVFDEATQSFPTQGVLESVYRQFPGSKADTLQPDTAIFSLNSNLNYLYQTGIMQNNINPTIDKRFNYRIVAAVWMDKPYFFGTEYPSAAVPPGVSYPTGQGVTFQNDATNPMVVGVCGALPPNATTFTCTPPDPINLYPNVSQGVFCGIALDSTDTSGDSLTATGANNTVPGCSTRADDLAWADNPVALFSTIFSQGAGPVDGPLGGIPPLLAAGTDYEFSLLGGEDRLSSTSMETFTQNGTFHNCFACHNTSPISTNGTPYDPGNPGGLQELLLKPANLNVSHLFSEFILRDATEVCGTSTSGPTTIPCAAEVDGGAQ
jgi:hypothetical protein